MTSECAAAAGAGVAVEPAAAGVRVGVERARRETPHLATTLSPLSALLLMTAAAAPAPPPAAGGASLGKGAWDCDARAPIPPDREVGGADGAGTARAGGRSVQNRFGGWEAPARAETVAPSRPARHALGPVSPPRPKFLKRSPPWTFPFTASPPCPRARTWATWWEGGGGGGRSRAAPRARRPSLAPGVFLQGHPVPGDRFPRLDSGAGVLARGAGEAGAPPPASPNLHLLSLSQVKRALWAGGIARSNRADGKGSTPGLRAWQDLVREEEEGERRAAGVDRRARPNLPSLLSPSVAHLRGRHPSRQRDHPGVVRRAAGGWRGERGGGGPRRALGRPAPSFPPPCPGLPGARRHRDRAPDRAARRRLAVLGLREGGERVAEGRGFRALPSVVTRAAPSVPISRVKSFCRAWCTWWPRRARGRRTRTRRRRRGAGTRSGGPS